MSILKFVCAFILATLIEDCLCDGDPFSDNKPYFAHSLKVQIRPYFEECVWQRLKVGTYMSFGFEVLRGGDKKIMFTLRDPNGVIIEHMQEKEELFIEKNIELEGTYGFCMDNRDSNFAEKLVFFYLSGYTSYDWEMNAGEMEQYNEKAETITTALGNVDGHVQKMVNYQSVGKIHLIADWYLITGNLQWVTYWSAFQSFVIAVVGFGQVFFIKRLFDSNPSGASALLRASA